MKRLLWIPVLGFLPLVVGGCRVTTEPVAPVVTVEGYAPLRYDGYVVFYDAGEPYYVVRGRRHYISRSNPRYQRYIRHYHTYRDHEGYRRWERDHAPRPDYQTRRGPRVYDTDRYHRPR